MIYDISQKISQNTAVWPGDTNFSSQRVMEISKGMSCNVTTITMSVHCGTHSDAPLHFEEGAESIGEVALSPYIGPVLVHSVLEKQGPIKLDELPSLDGVQRLLFKSYQSVDETKFDKKFRPLSEEVAQALLEVDLQLVGIEGQSMDAFDSQTLPVHKRLRQGNVAILENLDLSGVSAGTYELIALPLRLIGIDASPVRAILRTLS